MKQEREHWIALFPVQYSLNILFGRHFFSRLVIMGNPSAANETLEPFKDRQFIHGLHQPHSDAEFSIVGGHGNIDDIKGVSIVLMCADIPVVRHFIPAVVRMMRIKISHERCHRTDDAAFGNCAKRSIGKSFNMGMEPLLHSTEGLPETEAESILFGEQSNREYLFCCNCGCPPADKKCRYRRKTVYRSPITPFAISSIIPLF